MKVFVFVLCLIFVLPAFAEPNEHDERERAEIFNHLDTRSDQELEYLLLSDPIITDPVSSFEKPLYFDVYFILSAAISPTSPDTRLHMVRSLLKNRAGVLKTVNSIADFAQKQRVINAMTEAGTRQWATTLVDLCSDTFTVESMSNMGKIKKKLKL